MDFIINSFSLASAKDFPLSVKYPYAKSNDLFCLLFVFFCSTSFAFKSKEDLFISDCSLLFSIDCVSDVDKSSFCISASILLSSKVFCICCFSLSFNIGSNFLCIKSLALFTLLILSLLIACSRLFKSTFNCFSCTLSNKSLPIFLAASISISFCFC